MINTGNVELDACPWPGIVLGLNLEIVTPPGSILGSNCSTGMEFNFEFVNDRPNCKVMLYNFCSNNTSNRVFHV